MLFETNRLYMREMTEQDAKDMYLLNLNQEVIQYTGDVPFISIEEARQFLLNYNHYKKYGFGRWAVILKENNEFLGWCGLKYTSDKMEYDIGFRFFKKHWNKGYATESAKACVRMGFEKYKIKEIIGRVMKANKSSIRVLEKIGLILEKEFIFEKEEGFIYKIKAPI